MAQVSIQEMVMQFTSTLYKRLTSAYDRAHSHTNLRALNDPTELKQWIGLLNSTDIQNAYAKVSPADFNVGDTIGVDSVDGVNKFVNQSPSELRGILEVQKPVSIIYADLLTKKNNSTLTEGQTYLISDYRTRYKMPNADIIITCNIEPLVAKALTVNSFEPIAYSPLYPQDIIYYNFNNDQIMVPECDRGYISRRVDTYNNNSIPNDYRNIKYRRWQINVTDVFDINTQYQKGNVIVSPNDNTQIYIALDSTINNPLDNEGKWRQFEWSNLSYVSPQADWYIIDDAFQIHIPCSSNYQDLLFLQDTTSCHSNKIESASTDIILNFNNVIFGAYFYSNSIGANFNSNSIGANFYSNSIGVNFSSNSIGANFNSNSIGAYFYSNSIGAYFNYNSIGAGFSSNSIGANFYSNSIGAYFYSNSIGANFYSNSIGAYFNSDEGQTTWGDGVKMLTIPDNIWFYGDLTSQNTILSGNYSKEVIKTVGGLFKLKYLQDDGTYTITNFVAE